MDVVLGIAGFAVGLVGIVLTIYYARRSERFNMLRKRLEWPDLQAAANDLAHRIKRDFVPVAIVTPGLRGATFANLLAAEFVDQPPVYVGVSTWKEDAPNKPMLGDSFQIDTKKWYVEIPKAISRYTHGTILVVDDFCNVR
jgi:hypoxanthine phosphoribosyltransferase